MSVSLLPFIIITFATSFLLCIVNAIAYRDLKHPALHVWALSWGFYASRFLFDLLSVAYPWAGWQTLLQLSVLVSGFLLLKGVYLYISPTEKLPAGWALFAGTAGVAVLGGWLFPVPSLVPLLLSFLFLGLSNIVMGWYFLQNRTLPKLERLFMGLVFILWGLHKLNYPFLRPYPQFAVWGYTLGSVLGFSAGAGLMFIFLAAEKRRTEEAESRFRIVANSIEDAIFTLDSDCRVKEWFGRLFKQEARAGDSYVGRTAIDILGPELGTIHLEMAQKVFQENRSVTYEWVIPLPEGKRYFQTTLSPVSDEKGNCVEIVGISREITSLREALGEVQKRLEEKTVLIQEIQHRVQNNLQVIISLLNLQAQTVSSQEAKKEFALAISRIHTLADIYTQLQGSMDMAHIRIDRFLESLVARLSDPDLFPTSPKFHLDVREEVLPLDKALPVGLILNELVHTCFEASRPPDSDTTAPSVHIFMRRNNDALEIRISPSRCAEELVTPRGEPQDRFRMELLESLVMHLEGRIEATDEKEIRVCLPVFETP